ncbi:MAG: hypothetical protein ACPL0A_01030 [Candidatus Micrarchaeia archaeon]
MLGLSRIITDAIEELTREEEVYRARRSEYEEVVRLCGRAMQMIHASRIDDAKVLYEDITKIVKNLPMLGSDEPSLVAMQEYSELSIMLSIVTGEDVPHYRAIGVSPDAYILGLADAVGELRRQVIEGLRRDDYAHANAMFDNMSEIYELLLPVRFSSSFLPGFRRKLDVARSVVEQCRRDILMYKISKNL